MKTKKLGKSNFDRFVVIIQDKHSKNHSKFIAERSKNSTEARDEARESLPDCYDIISVMRE